MAVPQPQNRALAGPQDEREEAAERRLLDLVAQVAARQRAAIIERDLPSLNRLFEALIQILGECTLVLEARAARGNSKPGASMAALARQIREQLGINRLLLANGIAMVDHFIACISAASAMSASPSQSAGGPASDGVPAAALFSGVA